MIRQIAIATPAKSEMDRHFTIITHLKSESTRQKSIASHHFPGLIHHQQRQFQKITKFSDSFIGTTASDNLPTPPTPTLNIRPPPEPEAHTNFQNERDETKHQRRALSAGERGLLARSGWHPARHIVRRSSREGRAPPAHLKRRRRCIIQPRVARHELPWVRRGKGINPNGVESNARHRGDDRESAL